jgi:Kef-type K+ transport system membrane component KefB
MYALVHSLTGNPAAGWLAGLAYAFLPWRVVHFWHLNWLQSAWLPWIAVAFLRLLERPTTSRAIVLGVLVAVQTLTSFYFAVQIALLLGALLAGAMVSDRRFRSRRS